MNDLIIQQIANGIIIGFAYAMASVGLTMIFGVLRAINFAHGEYFMCGAFASWAVIHYFQLPYIISIPVSIIISAGIAVIISRIVMEPLVDAPFSTAVLATLGVYLILQNTTRLLFGGTYKFFSGGWLEMLTIMGVTIIEQRMVLIIITVAIFLFLEWMIRRTRIGKAMRAVAQNHEACIIVGINIELVTRFTFCLGVLLAALAGVLMSPIIVTIYPTMGEGMTFKAFAITVIGGMGNVRGTFLSAIFIGIVECFVAGFLGLQFREAVGFVALIIVLMWRPYGLFTLKGRF